jgi:histidinol-phosphate phosphatase family protein
MTGPDVDLVVPTLGRESLAVLLRTLAAGADGRPGRIILVDDRPRPQEPLLPAGIPSALAGRIEVRRSGGRGPAAARNAGWRASRADWIAFVDDDVVPDPDWADRLEDDVASAAPATGAVQGRIRVPLDRTRRPTDWERNVAGLESATWATADMAYRRAALEQAGGFDERFRRAYREDADLGLRLTAAGWRIERGRRTVSHPVRPARWDVSLRLQAGNAEDPVMAALHGSGWRERAAVPRGRRRRHLATTAALGLAAGAALGGRRPLAVAGAAGWLAGTADLAWARIAPGPRTRDEVARMLATSALMPPVATAWWMRGVGRALAIDRLRRRRPDAVLLDRDGTLIRDVPYNGDPARVEPLPGAREALDRLRAAGVRIGIVSNQSGVARGLISSEDVHAVNRRVEELLGPVGTWEVCPHEPADGCGCRKPAPGMVLSAARRLGVAPERCAVIGDIGADVAAARAAGARAVLVPTPVTRPEEVAAAPVVAPDLGHAVELLLGGRA